MDRDDLENFSDSSSSEDCVCEEIDSDSGPEDAVGALLPYRFEPYLSDEQSDEANSDSDEDADPGAAGGHGGEVDAQGGGFPGEIPMDVERLQNTEWCSCGGCVNSPTVRESVCCREQMRVCERREKHPGVVCITQHRGFAQVCLSEDVLETAYLALREDHAVNFGNDWKRYTAYRQFVRWCYEHLGKSVRVPLPSCAVAAIRSHFPSADYTGFREADD
ncbi:uncharacterized protein [Branchiostoma lanceolatum]|uniref:uncharacterized protein n=1 Tax=Branchiostoma lanceolatum TaxID=7740 RepID=UPI003453A79B